MFKAIVFSACDANTPVVAAPGAEKGEPVLIVDPQVLPAVPALAARPGMVSRLD